MLKLQQKLMFTEQELVFDSDSRQNVQKQKILFSEWADVRNVQSQTDQNGNQIAELSYTHTAATRWLKSVDNNMLCYRRIMQPDRSITNQYFRVLSFEPYGQENRYMLLKLSEVADGY